MNNDRRIGKRINLTLPQDVAAVLARMGKVTGAGTATIIREWLTDGLPHFEQLARALELAAAKNIDAFAVMTNIVTDAANQADQLSLDIKSGRRAAMRKRKKTA